LNQQDKRGICIWLTGLSGSGKTTIATLIVQQILKIGQGVTLLDGDQVRKHLSKNLGFSREDRNQNIRSIGFVADRIVYHGGIVVCAVISPYRIIRDEIRDKIENNGHFVEVFVNTPPSICEHRDPKGYYAKARKGEIIGFTGIDDPYEAPLQPEIVAETVAHSPEQNAKLILNYLNYTVWEQYSV